MWMNRNYWIFLIICVLFFTVSGCKKEGTDNEQPYVECSIFPIDFYTGEIRLLVMRDRDLTFAAFLIPSSDSGDCKRIFDRNANIPRTEKYVSDQLKDYGKSVELEMLAAFPDQDFRLTCDKPIFGKEAGEDLSSCFYVYPIARFSYPDFNLKSKHYDISTVPTLFEYLTEKSIWVQSNITMGLCFAPVDITCFEPDHDTYTFTLHIPFIGKTSDGSEVQKVFEGSFDIRPNLPPEPDLV